MSTIRFRCIRCQHAVEAPESKIGRKMYCPVCFFQLTVPAEGTIKPVDSSDLYEADAAPLDVRDMQARREFTSLRCDICHTNIAVKREQIGEEIVCPECGTKITIPESIGKKFEAAIDAKLDRIMSKFDSGNVYGVHNDSSGAVADDGKIRIPVHCKLCNTLMYATEEQIGRELTCPDCDTKTAVRAPAKKFGPAATGGAYEGASTFGVESEIPVGAGPLVPVVCSLCDTRMYALESEIGGVKICPDCGRENEIKAVPKKDLYVPDAPGDEYSVDADASPPSRPAFRTMTDYRFVEGSLDKEHYDREGITAEMLSAASAADSYEIQTPSPLKKPPRRTEFSSPSAGPDDAIDMETLRERRQKKKDLAGTPPPIQRPELPAHPFRTRLFEPLRNPWIVLRSVVAIAAGTFGLYLGTALPGLYRFVGLPIGALFLFFGFAVLADSGQSIFLWTTSGNDRPEEDDWSDFAPHESLAFAAWLFGLVLLAATPGYFLGLVFSGESVPQTVSQDLQRTALVGAASATANSDLWFWMFLHSNRPTFLSTTKLVFDFLLMVVSLGLFFPVFFLSSMEAGSYFMLLSRGTLRSLAFETVAWLRFYVAILLLALSLLVVHCLSLSLMFTDLPERIAYAVLLFINVTAWTGAMLVYFRILGRFAWLLETLAQEEND